MSKARRTSQGSSEGRWVRSFSRSSSRRASIWRSVRSRLKFSGRLARDPIVQFTPNGQAFERATPVGIRAPLESSGAAAFLLYGIKRRGPADGGLSELPL